MDLDGGSVLHRPEFNFAPEISPGAKTLGAGPLLRGRGRAEIGNPAGNLERGS